MVPPRTTTNPFVKTQDATQDFVAKLNLILKQMNVTGPNGGRNLKNAVAQGNAALKDIQDQYNKALKQIQTPAD